MFVVTDLIGQQHWQIHDKLYYLLARGFERWDDPRRELEVILKDLHISPAMFGPRGSTRSAVSAIAAILPAMSQSDVTRFMAAIESMVGNTHHAIPQAVTWSMIEQMRRSGFTIGSHTKTQSRCRGADETATEEPDRIEMRARTAPRRPVVHCLSGGHFTPKVVDRVAGAGYQFGYTACPLTAIPATRRQVERLMLWEGSSIDAAGNFSSVLSCQSDSPALLRTVHHHASSSSWMAGSIRRCGPLPAARSDSSPHRAPLVLVRLSLTTFGTYKRCS